MNNILKVKEYLLSYFSTEQVYSDLKEVLKNEIEDIDVISVVGSTGDLKKQMNLCFLDHNREGVVKNFDIILDGDKTIKQIKVIIRGGEHYHYRIEVDLQYISIKEYDVFFRIWYDLEELYIVSYEMYYK